MRRVLVPLLSPGRAAAFEIPRPGAAIQWLEGQTMGTTWRVGVVAPPGFGVPELREAVQARLDDIVAQMSHWESDSWVSRYNAAPAGTWTPLREETLQVLSHAKEVAQASGGAFDPTSGALVDLWGFGPAAADRREDGGRGPLARLPAASEVHSLLQQAGWRRLEIDLRRRAAFQPGGLRLDLSAIAKGFGVDQVCRLLTAAGLASHLVEVGGELRGAGIKPDGQPWWVALEHPAGSDPGASARRTRHVETVVALHGQAVATSGDYRRYFDIAGRRYSHTIDPRSGCPIQAGPASVTVLHESAMAADALSTALMVMGKDEGYTWAEQHGLAALFISRHDCDSPDADPYSERMTGAFAALLQ
jgi:thiamine biosynthesis lipoprotein